jgi:hypothetical protein
LAIAWVAGPAKQVSRIALSMDFAKRVAAVAEAGCSIHEIKAISGHRSTGEVERYTVAVDQKAMAERAIARTLTTHSAIPNYPQ